MSRRHLLPTDFIELSTPPVTLKMYVHERRASLWRLKVGVNGSNVNKPPHISMSE